MIKFCLCFMVFISTSIALAETDIEIEKKASKAYLEKIKAEPGTAEIEKGVLIKPIFKAASDQFASVEDTVRVIYHGLNRDGSVFDSSFGLNGTSIGKSPALFRTSISSGTISFPPGACFELTMEPLT